MKRARISLVLTAFAVTLLAPTTVGARGSDAAAAARAEHDRIVAYWTPARMAAARPKDFAYDPKLGRITPFPKPPGGPGGGGGGGGGGTVTGASWTGGGEINERSGKLFFSTSAGNWQCSASVVNSSASGSQAVIVTAGHCLFDGREGWSYRVVYIPNYDAAPTSTCSATLYGCWTATRLAIHSDFHPSGFGPDQALRVDYGFALVGPGGKGGSVPADLDSATGGYGLNTGTVAHNIDKWAFGYPAAGKYKGKDLTYCKGPSVDDPYGADTWGVACNMTGGSSGGPWIYGTNNPAVYSTGTLVTSVNSYGYQGLNYMFGPRFNAATGTVFGDAADGSASSVTVLCTTGANEASVATCP